LACLVGFGSSWALIPAMVGVACGIAGMQSRRRDLAATGLVISVVAIFLGFAQVGAIIWTKYQSRQRINEYMQQDY
jgi:O-antigen ligase